VTLVDSSGWIEFFADGPRGDRYAPYLKRPDEVLIPTVVLYEVYALAVTLADGSRRALIGS
jgi:hypothetical protein